MRRWCGVSVLLFLLAPPQGGAATDICARLSAGLAAPEATENGRMRAAILRDLAANRCHLRVGQKAPALQRSAFGAAMLDGGIRIYGLAPEANASGLQGYRTLCVRTCDGYYFPISFATDPSRFAADERTCQSLCPGAAARLYAHADPAADVSRAVSLAGEPYTALPSAYRYRTVYDPACTCRAAGLATPRPHTAALAAADGSADPPPALRPLDPPRTAVRVVGPPEFVAR